jgi:hypothetical protein
MSTARFIKLVCDKVELAKGVKHLLISYFSKCSFEENWETEFKSYFYKTFKVDPSDGTETATVYVIEVANNVLAPAG